MKLRRILVALKPWERGLPFAANHARPLAQSGNAQLQVMSTAFDSGLAAAGDRGEESARVAQDRTLAATRVELERLASSLRQGGVPVTTKAVWGAPTYERIIAAAQDWRADLLVVGAHERETLHARLTDTDWQLMRRAPCPLLLVKGAPFKGYRTILAAVGPLRQPSSHGRHRAVLDAARCFAEAFGATLRAVYAYRGVGRLELAGELGLTPNAVDLVPGGAAQTVVDLASHHRADLVVIGTSHRRGTSADIGDTAELVAAEVPCDMLLVPPERRVRAVSKVG